jgi:hypothetical protein
MEQYPPTSADLVDMELPALRAEIKRLEARIAELERRLAQVPTPADLRPPYLPHPYPRTPPFPGYCPWIIS